jgi:hypothetical protein
VLRYFFTLVAFPFFVAAPLRWPFFGVVSILGTFVLYDVIFAERFDLFYELHGPETLFITTFLGILLNEPDRLRDFVPRHVVDFGMLGFLAIMLISGILNNVPYLLLGNKYVSMFWQVVVFYFLVTRLTDSEKRVLTLTFTLIATTSYLVYVAWDKSRTKDYHFARPYSFSSHHDFGAQLLLTLPLIGTMVTWQARERVRLWKWVRIALLLLIPLYILTGMRTQSRSAYLGLAVVLPLLLWYHRRRWSLALLASPVILFALLHQDPRVFASIESIWTHQTPTGQPDPSIGSRFRQMNTAMNIFQSHPILGIGPRMFFYQYLQWASPEELTSEGRYTMHCVPLLILTEEGLFGFVTYYLLIVGGTFLSAWRTLRAARMRDRPELTTMAIVASGCLIGLIAWVAFSLGQPSAWTFNIYATFALVVAAEQVALRLLDEETAEEPAAPPVVNPFAPGATEVVFS